MTAPGIHPRPDWDGLRVWHAEDPLLRRDVPLLQLARELSGVVYLATPYSLEVTDAAGHWCPRRSLEAQARASYWAGLLAEKGVSAFAPVSLSADMVHVLGRSRLEPLDADFWMRWCAPFLAASHALVVPPVPGWDRSRGVWAEVLTALGANKPVFLLREAC